MTLEECLTVARAELNMAKHLIQDEIRDYPTPISGCDAQFNHLVGMRGSISEALRALEGPALEQLLARAEALEGRALPLTAEARAALGVACDAHQQMA